jgi:alkylation response protein AidB-like acyl-CoA dehydrogenase
MDLDPTPEQQLIVEAVHSLLANHCSPEVVRSSEPGGFDPKLWTVLSQLAGPAIGIPEDRGGGGATLLDLELISEQIGAFLAPVPFIEGAVAARTLAAIGDEGGGDLDALIDGSDTVGTIALRPAVGGRARMVPAGAIAGVVLAMDADDLVVVRGRPAEGGRRNLGSSPLADRSVRETDRAVLSSGTAAARAYGNAQDEWRVLMSGALVGIGEAALTLGVGYARDRHQFGVPIGSFQSIARDLADAATLVDGARLLAREAAWARGEGDQDFGSLASMAFLFAVRAARQATGVSLHVHGGYGFTLEYDIQLYYRRARGWALVFDDPSRECLRLADGLFGPVAGAA